MKIKNRSFFPYVNFFTVDKFKLIGKCADKNLLLIGRAKVYGDPIVAICQTDEPGKEDLSACELYELMKFSNNTIKLTEATS